MHLYVGKLGSRQDVFAGKEQRPIVGNGSVKLVHRECELTAHRPTSLSSVVCLTLDCSSELVSQARAYHMTGESIRNQINSNQFNSDQVVDTLESELS